MLLHKVSFVSLNLMPRPGNSSRTKTVLLSSDNRYTLLQQEMETLIHALIFISQKRVYWSFLLVSFPEWY